MRIILAMLLLMFILPACNKPKKTKAANNAVTKYHKKQTDKVKKAKSNVKKLNIDLKSNEDRAKKLKNE